MRKLAVSTILFAGLLLMSSAGTEQKVLAQPKGGPDATSIYNIRTECGWCPFAANGPDEMWVCGKFDLKGLKANTIYKVKFFVRYEETGGASVAWYHSILPAEVSGGAKNNIEFWFRGKMEYPPPPYTYIFSPPAGQGWYVFAALYEMNGYEETTVFVTDPQWYEDGYYNDSVNWSAPYYPE